MKKLFKFLSTSFSQTYTYNNFFYINQNQLCIGYVITDNQRFFWLPLKFNVMVCYDREELELALDILNENI